MNKRVAVVLGSLAAIGLVIILASVVLSRIDYSVTGGAVGDIAEGVVSCTDSDGADAWNTRGFVTVAYDDGNSETRTDFCENGAAIDYSCTAEGNVISSSKACSCSGGACETALCSGTQCNPDNSKQICSGGAWVECSGEQVCSLGTCKEPEFVAEVRVAGGGSGGSGGSSGTTSSASPAPSTPERSVGTIDGSMYVEASAPEKLIFTLAGTQHSITVSAIDATSATVAVDSAAAGMLSPGDERLYDFNGDGANDLSLQLKSINLGSKTARLLLSDL